MEEVGSRLRAIARRRRDRFEAPEEFADYLSRRSVFERVDPGVVDLFAHTILRRAVDGTGFELRCPREYEAQVYQYTFCWTVTVDLDSVVCPVKAIGADPTVPNSYIPSIDIRELVLVDYDFIPETTHLLQLGGPEKCAALALEFLEGCGLA